VRVFILRFGRLEVRQVKYDSDIRPISLNSSRTKDRIIENTVATLMALSGQPTELESLARQATG